MSEFSQWDGFYSVVGSAAGTLIGLQFVVITLLAGRTAPRAPEAAVAFATPTIVHFSAVLLLSALLRAPWQTITTAIALCCLAGLAGVVYARIVSRRIRKQAAYQPEFEDWLCHGVLPFAAYATLALSALVAFSHTHQALFGIAAAALLLLFIHNAWDAGAYHVFVQRAQAERQNLASKREQP
jgi:L-asparagine transporter-like permease